MSTETREDKRGAHGEIEPWTFKAILGAGATSLLLIAKALDRIATEYERRGQS